MSAIINPVDSNLRGGSYGLPWASIYDLELNPQVWQKWYQLYGDGFNIFDFLTIAGSTTSVSAWEITAFADNAVEKFARVTAAGVSSAGHVALAAITFVLHANEYLDADGATACTPHLRDGDTVFMDPQYTTADVPTQWYVVSVGDAGANTTIRPLNADVVMDVDMPANSYFMVGPHIEGVGTGQPGPRRSGAVSSTFKTAILDETAEIKGGLHAQALYRNDLDKSGKSRLWNKAQVEMEFALNAGMDKEIFLGEENDNPNNAITADGDAANQSVKGTKGLWQHVESDGMEQAYAGSYDLAYFDQIKEYLRSQGVTDTNVATLAGSNLYKQIENTVLDYIKAYSGGTDLVDDYNSVGANFQQFTKNGITHQLCEIVSFDNANTYAIMDTYFRDAGLIIPQSLATVRSTGISSGEKVSIPNVAIGYLNNNGENRTRMIGPVAGVNAFGYPFTNQYDAVKMYVKTEFMLIVNLANQMLKVVKEGTF